jgi:hypothetical protein
VGAPPVVTWIHGKKKLVSRNAYGVAAQVVLERGLQDSKGLRATQHGPWLFLMFVEEFILIYNGI